MAKSDKAQSEKNVPEVQKDALEDVQKAEQKSTIFDPENLDFLISEEFLDHVNPLDKNMVSSKYDHEREPKVQEGIEELKRLFPNVNPLVYLLGKWWENKSVRATLKTMIDNEAEEKGIDPVVYMQSELRDQIEPMKNMVSGIERLSYAITYFKPREAAASKKVKPMTIDNVMYNVPIVKAEELKKLHSGNLEALKAALIEVGTLVEVEEL